MNFMQIEQHLGERKIAYTAKEIKEYSFPIELPAGCRFRSCNARLTMRADSEALHLNIELPIFLRQSEYAAVRSELTALNDIMMRNSAFSGESFTSTENFTLDTANGAVCYEISAQAIPAAMLDLPTLLQQVEAHVGQSILKWADEILCIVSREIQYREFEAQREAQSESEQEDPTEAHFEYERMSKKPARTPIERILELIGVVSPEIVDYPESFEEE